MKNLLIIICIICVSGLAAIFVTMPNPAKTKIVAAITLSSYNEDTDRWINRELDKGTTNHEHLCCTYISMHFFDTDSFRITIVEHTFIKFQQMYSIRVSCVKFDGSMVMVKSRGAYPEDKVSDSTIARIIKLGLDTKSK